MYAITFDIDTQCVEQTLGKAYNGIYSQIRTELAKFKFTPQQGSVYFGDSSVNAVTCVLAAQALAKNVDGFACCVRDIRMLRIEELNDLLPAVQSSI